MKNKRLNLAAIAVSIILLITGYYFASQPILNVNKEFEGLRVKLKKSQIVFHDVMEMPEISPEITRLVKIATRGEYNLKEVMTELDKAEKVSLKPPMGIPMIFFILATGILGCLAWIKTDKFLKIKAEKEELQTKLDEMKRDLMIIQEEYGEDESERETIEELQKRLVEEKIESLVQEREAEAMEYENEIAELENRPSLTPSIYNPNYIDWICEKRKIDLDRSMQLGEKFNHLVPKEISHHFYLGVIQDLELDEKEPNIIKLAEDRDNRTFLYQVKVVSDSEVDYNLDSVANTFKYIEDLHSEFIYSIDIEHTMTQKLVDFNLKVTIPTKA